MICDGWISKCTLKCSREMPIIPPRPKKVKYGFFLAKPYANGIMGKKPIKTRAKSELRITAAETQVNAPKHVMLAFRMSDMVTPLLFVWLPRFRKLIIVSTQPNFVNHCIPTVDCPLKKDQF